MQARQLDHKVEFIPPKWANHYTKEDLPHRRSNMASAGENFWYMELGGENDCIEDTEELRDELLKVAFGIWDYVKNSGDCDADNWELDWVGFLPGKRESRRYVGDYIMTQHDVRSEGRFDDLIAYGGWTTITRPVSVPRSRLRFIILRRLRMAYHIGVSILKILRICILPAVISV